MSAQPLPEPRPDLRDLPGSVDGRFPAGCPSRTLLTHVTGKWGVLVLVTLSRGTLRWSELLRGIDGISEKMLAQTLRTFEADGLVVRTVAAVVPPRVDYRLSASGAEVTDLLLPLVTWAFHHTEAAPPAPARATSP